MAFRCTVLERHPWRACSLAEDTEYTLRLLRAGVRVWFADGAAVITRQPVTREQVRVQRTRWAAGNLGLARSEALRLLWECLAQRRPLLADAGWTLLVLSRPLVWLQAGLAALLALASYRLQATMLSAALLEASLAVLLLHGLLVAAAVLRLGISRRRLALLCRGLPTVARLAALQVRSLLRKHLTAAWVRTPRTPVGP
jgi:cellulose synthase/poly-beta-1,6-N-acetylglucosamine synthase-like glycosyltransferase